MGYLCSGPKSDLRQQQGNGHQQAEHPGAELLGVVQAAVEVVPQSLRSG
jgi:hypothetical protein